MGRDMGQTSDAGPRMSAPPCSHPHARHPVPRRRADVHDPPPISTGLAGGDDASQDVTNEDEHDELGAASPSPAPRAARRAAGTKGRSPAQLATVARGRARKAEAAAAEAEAVPLDAVEDALGYLFAASPDVPIKLLLERLGGQYSRASVGRVLTAIEESGQEVILYNRRDGVVHVV